MEEARQHPALTKWDWLAIAGKAVLLLCALGIVISVFLDQRLIIPLATIACFGAVTNLAPNIGKAIDQKLVRWRKTELRLQDSPKAYWMALFALIATFALWTLAGLKLMEMI